MTEYEMKKWRRLVMVGCLLIHHWFAACGDARDEFDAPSNPGPSKLVVGTKHSPPFAFKNPDGQWTGISIEMWQQLTAELNLDYELRELTLDEMLGGLETGELDAAVAAISVTAERHRRVDFCHPHFTTGLGIAASTQNSATPWSLVRRIVSARLLIIVAIMVAIVAVCGLLFWLLERRCNESIFSGGRRRGIGMGIWWSTILLLGHKGVVPASTSGRIVAACSMIASIFLLSLLTGVIASVLTVQQLDTGIVQPSDLKQVRVVTAASSTSADYLRRRHIAFRARPTAQAALQAVAHGQADAVVYDEALLKYLANTEFAGSVQVLPISFNTQEYAIALRPGSPWRKPLNEALLHYRASDEWDALIYRFLGD
jgi:ABC-type amino acid transport substrate-binding protein